MGLILGTSKSSEEMAGEIARLAAGKQHRLAAYLVDGRHHVNPAQYDGILRHLSRCPDLEEASTPMAPPTGAERYFAQRGEASSEYREAHAAALGRAHAVISDIPQGFYATPCRTGNNDLDFWKVTEGRKPGVRFAKRVIGGGDTKYPRLVEISQQEQRAALGAILRTGIDKAGKDYADNQERCKKCGIHLTDDESRSARMGPVCRGDR
jgi:hypothetical protein